MNKKTISALSGVPKLSEHAEQVALFQWARQAAQSGEHPELALMFAIPNGGARNRATAGRLKAEGVVAGVPDVCLPVARKTAHSLWIELKATHGGRVSPAQRAFMDRLWGEGHHVVVAFGWLAARDAIVEYLLEGGDAAC